MAVKLKDDVSTKKKKKQQQEEKKRPSAENQKAGVVQVDTGKGKTYGSRAKDANDRVNERNRLYTWEDAENERKQYQSYAGGQNQEPANEFERFRRDNERLRAENAYHSAVTDAKIAMRERGNNYRASHWMRHPEQEAVQNYSDSSTWRAIASYAAQVGDKETYDDAMKRADASRQTGDKYADRYKNVQQQRAYTAARDYGRQMERLAEEDPGYYKYLTSTSDQARQAQADARAQTEAAYARRANASGALNRYNPGEENEDGVFGKIKAGAEYDAARRNYEAAWEREKAWDTAAQYHEQNEREELNRRVLSLPDFDERTASDAFAQARDQDLERASKGRSWWTDSVTAPSPYTLLDQMSKDEQAVYGYLLSKGKTQDAYDYLNLMRDELQYRHDSGLAKERYVVDQPWNIDDTAKKLLRYTFDSAVTGLERADYGIRNVVERNPGEFDTEGSRLLSNATQQMEETAPEAGSFLYRNWGSAMQSLGQMAPAMLAGWAGGAITGAMGTGMAGTGALSATNIASTSATVGQLAQNSVFFLSCKGNAYADAKSRRGMTDAQAEAYSTLSALTEVYLQDTFGSVLEYGGIGNSQLAERINMLDNALARSAGKVGLGYVGEIFLDEVPQDFLDPFYETILTGKEYEAPTAAELLDTIASTFLMVSTSNVGDTVSAVQQSKFKSSLRKVEDLARKLGQTDSRYQQLADHIGAYIQEVDSHPETMAFTPADVQAVLYWRNGIEQDTAARGAAVSGDAELTAAFNQYAADNGIRGLDENQLQKTDTAEKLLTERETEAVEQQNQQVQQEQTEQTGESEQQTQTKRQVRKQEREQARTERQEKRTVNQGLKAAQKLGKQATEIVNHIAAQVEGKTTAEAEKTLTDVAKKYPALRGVVNDIAQTNSARIYAGAKSLDALETMHKDNVNGLKDAGLRRAATEAYNAAVDRLADNGDRRAKSISAGSAAMRQGALDLSVRYEDGDQTVESSIRSITEDGKKVVLDNGEVKAIDELDLDIDTKDILSKLTGYGLGKYANKVLMQYQKAVQRGDVSSGYGFLAEYLEAMDAGRNNVSSVSELAKRMNISPETIGIAYDAGREQAKDVSTDRQADVDKLRAEAKQRAETERKAKAESKQDTSDTSKAKRGETIRAREKGVTGRKGTVDTSAISGQTLNRAQRQQLTFARILAEQLGLDVQIVFGGSTERNGITVYKGANGSYQNGKIQIDINAGRYSNLNKGSGILRAMSHELTHFIQQYSPALYQDLKDFAFDLLGKEKGYEGFRDLVDEKLARDTTRKLTVTEAEDEVLADACETMLRDSEVAAEAIRQAQENERYATLMDKLIGKIADFVAALKRVFGKAVHDEAKFVDKLDADMRKVFQDKWDAALKDAVEAYGEIGAMNNADGETQNSDRDTSEMTEEERDAAYAQAVKSNDMETAQKLVDAAAQRAGFNHKGYHQTAADFTRFNTEHESAGMYDSELPTGIYIKPTDKQIGVDGSKQMPLYFRADNMLEFANREAAKAYWMENVPGYREISEQLEAQDAEFSKKYDELDAQWFKLYSETYNEEDQSAVDDIDKQQDEILEQWNDALNPLRRQMKNLITDYMRSSEYDGIHLTRDKGGIGKGTIETYVLFNPDQVKSAEPATYDNDGELIPLDERFRTNRLGTGAWKNEDIRYSQRDAAQMTEEEWAQTRKRRGAQERRDAGEKLTESKFYSLYSAHKLNMVGRENIQEQIDDIRRNGFAGDGGPYGANLMPTRITYTTDKNGNRRPFGLSAAKYAPRQGDYIMLVPKNGAEINKYYDRVKQGWRPSFDYEIVQADYDYQPYYEMYSKAYDKAQAQLSERDAAEMTEEELLMQADESVAKNEEERRLLKEYQAKARQVTDLEERLEKIKSKLKAVREEKNAWKQKAQHNATLGRQMVESKNRDLRDAEITIQNAISILEKKVAKGREILNGKLQNRSLRRLINSVREEVLDQKNAQIGRMREGRKASELRGKIANLRKELTRRMTNPTDNAFVPPELAQAVVNVLDVLDMTPKEGTKAAERYANVTDALHKLSAAYGEIQTNDNLVAALDYEQEVRDRIDELAKLMDGRNVRELNSTELREVYEIARQVVYTLRDANKMINSRYNKSVYQLGEQEMQNQRDIRRRKNSKIAPFRGFNRFGSNVMLDALSPMRAVHMIGGYGDSVIYGLWQDIENGLGTKDRVIMDSNMRMQELRTGRNEKNYVNAIQKQRDFGVKDLDGNTVKMTEMQAMQLVMSWQREEANDKLVHMEKGGAEINGQRIAVDPQMIADVNDKLTEWDKQYMEAARDVFRSILKQSNDVLYALKHRVNQGEDLYIPFVVNRNFLQAQISDGHEFDLLTKAAGATKELKTKASQPLIIDGLDAVLNKHVNDMANYIGLAIPIRNFGKVLNAKTVGADVYTTTLRDELAKTWGTTKNRNGKAVTDNRAEKLMLETLRNLQNAGQSGYETGAAKAMAAIQSNFVKAALVGKVSVVVKQVASYESAGSILSQRALYAARHHIAEFLAAPNSKHAQKVMERWNKRTAELQKRRIGLSMEEIATERTRGSFRKDYLARLGANLEQNAVGRVVRDVAQATDPTNWIQRADVATTMALAIACEHQARIDGYKKGTAEYEQHVTELYERTIRQTQPMYDALHRPMLQQAQKGMGLIKAMMPFKTVPFQNMGQMVDAFGMFQESVRNGTREDKVNAGKFLGKTILANFRSTVVFSILTAVAYGLQHKTKRYRDDDEELTWESFLKQYGKDLLNVNVSTLLPYGGGELLDALERFAGEKKWYNIFSVGAVEHIEDTINSILKLNEVYDAFGEGDKSIDELKDQAIKTILQVTKFFGLPISNVKELYEGAVSNLENGMWTDADVERSNSVNARRYLEALDAGDTAKAQAVLEEMMGNIQAGGKSEYKANKDMVSNIQELVREKYLAGEYNDERIVEIMTGLGKDEDKTEQWVSGIYKKLYSDGDLSADEVRDKLLKYGGKSEDDVYWLLQKWDYQNEHEDEDADDWNVYMRLRDTISAGGDISDAVEELTSHGKRFVDVNKAVKGYVTEQFEKGEISEAEATELLVRYWKVKPEGEKQYQAATADDVYWAMEEKKYGIETGDDEEAPDWSNYLPLRNAIDANQNLDSVIKDMKDHGYVDSKIEQNIKNHLNLRFRDGTFDEAKYKNLLSRYLGITKTDVVDSMVNDGRCYKEYGVTAEKIDDAYKDGVLTASQTKQALMKYKGMDTTAAEHRIQAVDFNKQNKGLAWSVTGAEYYLFKTKPDDGIKSSPKDFGFTANEWDSYTSGVNKVEYQAGVSGAMKKAQMAFIATLGLSKEKMDYLYYWNGWSGKTIGEAPWH